MAHNYRYVHAFTGTHIVIHLFMPVSTHCIFMYYAECSAVMMTTAAVCISF